MGDRAAVFIEDFCRAPQMLRRLPMKLRRRRMVLRGSQPAFNGPGRQWRAGMLGGEIGLLDGEQCMALRQHGLMSRVIVILGRLVVLRCLAVKSRRLLVMRCSSIEMYFFYPASYSWQILLERLRFGGNRLRYLCIAKLLRHVSELNRPSLVNILMSGIGAHLHRFAPQ